MSVLASPAALEHRKAMCDTCINKGQQFGIDICNLCGCLLSVKMRLKSAKCPIKKWSK